MVRSFSFPILLVSLLFVTISLSSLNTQTPLWLTKYHFSVWQVGIVGSSYFVGNLVGALVANWLISKLNVKKTYAGTCILFAIATLGMSLSINLICWSFWRFLIGIACAITWIIVESCILVTSRSKNRGRMFAIYMTVYYLGTVFGQGLLRYFPKTIVYFALVVVLLMILAILFIFLTNYHLPVRKKKIFNIKPMLMYQPARLGLIGCIVAGMIIGAIYSLLPAYYEYLGLSDDQVANWMILVIASGLIAQIPVGYLADKYGTLWILVVDSVFFVFACFMIINNHFVIFSTIIIGATIYTVYPLSMAWACSTVNKQDIVLMNQTMLLVNTLGSLVAPAIISIFMNEFGNNYLFVSFIVIALYFIAVLVLNSKKYAMEV